MAPTKILFPFAGDTILGGSHVSALELACSLDRDRFEPQVLIHFEEGAVGQYARSLGLDFEVLPGIPLMGASNFRRANDVGALRYAISTFPALRRVLQQRRPDIVHTNEGRIHTNWTLPIKASSSKHLWHHRQDPRAFGINKLAPLFSDYIASVSEFSKPTAPIRNVDHKFRVVRSPFDFPSSRPDKPACHANICNELNLPSDAILLGYFGTLTKRKRPDHFVEAVASIVKRFPDRPVHGLLFGDVAAKAQKLDDICTALAETREITDRIHLMGYKKPIIGYMAGVDVMLVTALHEPFGRTLIEAMHLGTPVVATRHGGNVEAIVNGKTGFLVDHEDPAAFSDPVSNLLTQPDLYARISAAAHREAIANYGKDIHVRAISEIYDLLAP